MPVLVKSKKLKQHASGNPIGYNDSNPILDSGICELEFPGRLIGEFLVNVLAENLSNQDDLDGWYTGIVDEVIDILKDNSITVVKEDGTFITDSGQERDVVTTK